MRLGQLARKLARRPSEIVEFLSQRNMVVDDNSNTKLDDDQVNLIMQEFAPGTALDVADSPVISEVAAEKEVTEVAEPSSDPAPPVNLAAEETEDSSSSDSVEEVKPEVIKAPKVELAGLKVVGKIDLPEPKKKESALSSLGVADENPTEGLKSPAEIKRQPDKKDRSDQRPTRKNPITLQREREAQEAERKRQAKAEQEKEKRTKSYYNRVKASAPTKRVKMVEEPTTEMSAAELKETPKTWVGKFFHWLTK